MNTDTIMAAATQAMDELFPGWESHIDWDTLNIMDGCNCIAGQGSGIACADGSDPAYLSRLYAWEKASARMRNILGVDWDKTIPQHPFADSRAIPLWREFVEARLTQQAVVEEEMYV